MLLLDRFEVVLLATVQKQNDAPGIGRIVDSSKIMAHAGHRHTRRRAAQTVHDVIEDTENSHPSEG
ncbi:MAG: hypothetical protein P1U38_00145 [Aeromicrobium sp.]|uniref:hypothetical protein n=1 Tax=Aeromicrobium sp. TaxID=1871063 RepID=UPI002611EE2C|nr:hypothetical protein [Aeromicrobium sp.]MDF1703162.1 hypothetical protein [Aeromicrobium sp.]